MCNSWSFESTYMEVCFSDAGRCPELFKASNSKGPFNLTLPKKKFFFKKNFKFFLKFFSKKIFHFSKKKFKFFLKFFLEICVLVMLFGFSSGNLTWFSLVFRPGIGCAPMGCGPLVSALRTHHVSALTLLDRNSQIVCTNKWKRHKIRIQFLKKMKKKWHKKIQKLNNKIRTNKAAEIFRH